MALTIPNTFSTGAVSDPAKVNENFAAVGTYLDVTKLTTANLQTPYAQFTLSFQVEAALGVASKSFWCRVPAGQTWYGVEATVAFAASTGSPVVTLDGNVTFGGTTALLSAACSETVAGAITPRSAFVGASYAAGTMFEIVIANTGAGSTATGIYGTVTFKVLLRS